MPKRDIEDFIKHWSAASASERSNSQPFLKELCDLIEVPHPDNHPNAGYFFEYPVTEPHADGTTSQGRIDLYKRTCFVLESKQFQEAQAKLRNSSSPPKPPESSRKKILPARTRHGGVG